MLTLLLTVVRMTLVLSARSKLPRMISYSFPSHKLWNMSTNIETNIWTNIKTSKGTFMWTNMGKAIWELAAQPFSMKGLTMHLSLRHFVLNRSMAFWFLSENLKCFIHFNDCNSLRVTNQSTWGCRCPTGTQVAPDEGRILQGCRKMNKWIKQHNFKNGDGLRSAYHQSPIKSHSPINNQQFQSPMINHNH